MKSILYSKVPYCIAHCLNFAVLFSEWYHTFRSRVSVFMCIIGGVMLHPVLIEMSRNIYVCAVILLNLLKICIGTAT